MHVNAIAEPKSDCFATRLHPKSAWIQSMALLFLWYSNILFALASPRIGPLNVAIKSWNNTTYYLVKSPTILLVHHIIIFLHRPLLWCVESWETIGDLYVAHRSDRQTKLHSILDLPPSIGHQRKEVVESNNTKIPTLGSMTSWMLQNQKVQFQQRKASTIPIVAPWILPSDSNRENLSAVVSLNNSLIVVSWL